jgi:hypothetical protein
MAPSIDATAAKAQQFLKKFLLINFQAFNIKISIKDLRASHLISS